jgi:hypothetical protein
LWWLVPVLPLGIAAAIVVTKLLTLTGRVG